MRHADSQWRLIVGECLFVFVEEYAREEVRPDDDVISVLACWD